MSTSNPSADRRVADQVSELLGLPPGGISPAGVGLRLLHRTLLESYRLVPAWREAPPIIAHPLHALWPGDGTPPWIHIYDCNSAYLSAARNSMLAAGEPILSPGPGGAVVRLAVLEAPNTVPTRRYGWYMEATRALLEEEGGASGAFQSYVFPRRHRLLRPWADAIWGCRLAAPTEETRAFAKRIAVMTIGYLAHQPSDGRYRWWYQPQWRGEIIAQHAAKMARMVRRWRAEGAEVIGVRDDAIAISSREPDAYAACPEPGQIGSGLGRLKVQLSLAPGRSGPAYARLALASSPQRWFDELREASHGA